MENLRQTGKTFRRLLTGLVKASQGENIVFISDNEITSSYTLKLGNILLYNSISNFNINNNIIEFPYNTNSDKQGHLKFMTYEKWYDETKGKSYLDHIVIDDTLDNKVHYVDIHDCEYVVD